VRRERGWAPRALRTADSVGPIGHRKSESTMLRRLLRKAAIVLVIFVVTGALLYGFGLRVVLDGGGIPHLQFIESASAQAEKIARHREA
jgi:hypothetical protein